MKILMINGSPHPRGGDVPGQQSRKPRRKTGGLLGCCEKKEIGSAFLQRGVLLVQLFLARKVGLDASVMRDFYAARIGHNDHIRWHDYVCLHFNLRMLTELCTDSACSKENTIRCA